MPTILIGNTSVIDSLEGADPVTHDAGVLPSSPPHTPRPDLGQQITTVSPPPSFSLEEQVSACATAFIAHSASPAAWVEADDEDSRELAEAFAAQFGCPVGCPDNGIDDVHNHDTWKEG